MKTAVMKAKIKIPYKFKIGIIYKCKDCKHEWDAPNEEYIRQRKHANKFRELHWH